MQSLLPPHSDGLRPLRGHLPPCAIRDHETHGLPLSGSPGFLLRLLGGLHRDEPDLLLRFCRSNRVGTSSADIAPVLKLSCAESANQKPFGHLLPECPRGTNLFPPYPPLLRLHRGRPPEDPSAAGGNKAFSTCAAHLTVVIVAFWLRLHHLPEARVRREPRPGPPGGCSTVVTHAAEPDGELYTLRNKEVRVALRRIYLNT